MSPGGSRPRAVVVTASNRAAAGVYADTGGPLLVDALREWGFEVGDPLVVPDGEPVEAALRGAAGEAFLTTVDVSANRVGIEVAGPDAARLLAFGCSLDLDHPAFGMGRCAQTVVARAGVVLWQVDEVPTYRLLVRPSFAAYLHAWLEDAATGLG